MPDPRLVLREQAQRSHVMEAASTERHDAAYLADCRGCIMEAALDELGGNETIVALLTPIPRPEWITWTVSLRTKWAVDPEGQVFYNVIGTWHRAVMPGQRPWDA